MRIQRFTVNNLFGVFTHVVNLRMTDRITIIHGPNGYGKTVMLKILAELFGALKPATTLRRTRFDSVEVLFDDGQRLVIEKTNTEPSPQSDRAKRRKQSTEVAAYMFDSAGRKIHEGTLALRSMPEREREVLYYAERSLPVARVGEDLWRDLRNDELISREEMLERFEDALPSSASEIRERMPTWFAGVRKTLSVKLIQTHRLGHVGSQEQESGGLTVQRFSADLAKRIKTVLGQYATRSQELDRTFPERLIKQATSEMPVAELRGKLNALEERRAKLAEFGFLEREAGFLRGPSEDAARQKADVLSVYVQDVEMKLAVFDDLAEKIDLLTSGINARFRYKKMAIDREKGFVFVSDAGDRVAPRDLSSGEQHEIVMLYELLFLVPRPSLVLVDEPEISLHIAWQDQYLADLKRLVSAADLDVIVATHSPQIIGEDWNLTVALKGPEMAEAQAGA